METDYSALLTQHYDTLIRSIDPTDYFVNKLRIANVISKAEVAQIMSKSSADDRNVSILGFVLDSASIANSMRAFLKTLRDSGQEHVANVFEKKSEKMPLTDEHFRVLSIRLGEVERVMDPDCGIVDELVRRGVLADSNRQQLNALASGSAKAAALVRTLLRKSDCCYQQFIEALEHCGQDHVLYWLNSQQLGKQRDVKQDVPNFSPPIRQEFIESMEKNRAEIIENMNPRDSGLLDLMVGCKVLRDYDRVDPRVLDEPRTNCDMNVEIMRLIPRSSQAAFDKFMAALIASGQSHIAALFIGEEIHGKITIRYRDQVDKATQKAVELELKLKLSDLVRDGIQVDNALRQSLKANNVIVSYVKDGCIAIGFRCFTPDSLLKLRELYAANELDRLLTDVYCPALAGFGALSLNLKSVYDEFTRCAVSFEKNKLMTAAHRKALLSAAKSPPALKNVVITDELLNKLSLNERRKKAIKRSSGSKRVAALLQNVATQPDWAFNELIGVLRNHGHVTACQYISGLAIQYKSQTMESTEKSKEYAEAASLKCMLSDELLNLQTLDLDEQPNSCSDSLLRYCETLKVQIQEGTKREKRLTAELIDTRRQLEKMQNRRVHASYPLNYSSINQQQQSRLLRSEVLRGEVSSIADDHSGTSGDKSSGFVDELSAELLIHSQNISEISEGATRLPSFPPGCSTVTDAPSSTVRTPKTKSNFKKAFKGKQIQLFDLIDLGDSSPLLTRLAADGILLEHQTEKVRAFPETHRRVEILLALLKTRPDSLFEPFCQVLKECGHEAAVDLISDYQEHKMADKTFSDIFLGLSLAKRKTTSKTTTTASTTATMGNATVITESTSDVFSGYSSPPSPQSHVEIKDEFDEVLRLD